MSDHITRLRDMIREFRRVMDAYGCPERVALSKQRKWPRILECMHEFRLRLREKVSSLGLEAIREKDVQPVWIHTVCARVVERLEHNDIRAIQTRGETEKLSQLGPNMGRIGAEEVHLSLLPFADEKAMCPLDPTDIDV